MAGLVMLTGAAPAVADTENNGEMPPNPPEWATYDTDGDGTVTPAECAALTAYQQEAFAAWVNGPDGTGIFNTFHDEEARRWLESHFEDHRADECAPITDGTPDDGVEVDVGSVVGGPVTQVPGAIGNAVKRGFERTAEQFAEAYQELFETTTTLWLNVPSTSQVSADTANWLQDQGLMRTVTAVVGGIGLIIAMVRLAFTGRGETLAETMFGLLRMLIVGSAGIWFVQLLLLAGDEWSSWLVRSATAGSQNAGSDTLLALNPGLMFMLSLIGIITALIQMVMLVVRNAALVVMGGVWQVAAAVSVAGDATMWRRATAWMIALIAYKPAAAIVYAAGFRLLHGDAAYGDELLAAIEGMILLVLAVLVLPAMVRLIVPAASMGGPSTAGVLGAATGAIATGAVFAGGFGGMGAGGGEFASPSGAAPLPPATAGSLPSPGGTDRGPSGSDTSDGPAGAAPAGGAADGTAAAAPAGGASGAAVAGPAGAAVAAGAAAVKDAANGAVEGMSGPSGADAGDASTRSEPGGPEGAA